MAWHATGNSISMAEHDFGIKLPMLIKGVTFAGTDSVQMAIKAKADAEPIITKTFGDVTENTVYIELTEAESELLPVGSYVYVLDWYQDGVFMCNIIPMAEFKVVNKA